MAKWIVFVVSISAVFCAIAQHSSRIPSSLGSCDETHPCHDINSLCLEGTCNCRPGYTVNNSTTKCLKVAVKYSDSCEEDIQCSEFLNEGGICENNKCACGKSYHYLRGQCHETIEKRALKKDGGVKIGDKCRTAVDCESIENSICDVDGSCTCFSAFFPSEDRTVCVAEIGGLCGYNGTKVDPHVEHAICRENRWTCPIERFASRDNRRCIELVDEINGICEIDEQCRLLGPNARCSLGKRCECVHGNYDEEKHYCWTDIRDSCEKDSHCDIANTKCKDNKCACKEHHFELEGQCVAGLHANCKSNDECKTNNTECKSHYPDWCECKKGFVPTPEYECLPKLGHHEECKYDVQCSEGLLHSFCDKRKGGKSRCECKDEYFFKEDKCQRKKWVGDQCTESDECFSPKTRCKSGSCKCLPAHILVEGKCVLELGARCDDNSDCDASNSFCQNNRCACKKNYHEIDGHCAAGLKSACEKDDDCKYGNTVCHKTDKTCQCKADYVTTPDDKCLPKSRHHEKCEHDVQCFTPLPYSFCNYSASMPICDCIEWYHFQKNKCAKKKWVDEPCTDSEVCFTQNSHCVSGRCQCLPKFPKLIDGVCSSSTITRSLFSFVVLILLGLKVLL